MGYFIKRIPPKVRYQAAALIGRVFGKRFFWNLEALLKPKDAILSGCDDDAAFQQAGLRDATFIRETGLLHPNAVTLHIGCGMGRIEQHLAPWVNRAYGVDISRGMIRRARRHVRHNNVEFRVTSGEDLAGFDDAMFDLVYSTLVFQHLSRDTVARYLREVKRVLKPEGAFLCQYQYKGEDELVSDPPADHPWGIRLYSERELRGAGDTAGLPVERILQLEEARRLRAQGVDHARCSVWVIYRPLPVQSGGAA